MLDKFMKELPGFAGLLTRHLYNTLDTEQAALCIATSLSFISSIKADRIFSSQVQDVPNLFCISVAESGIGKTKCQQIITEILFKSDCQHLLMGEPGTYQGVLAALKRCNRQYLMWDEFGLALSELVTSKNGNRMLILSTLMKIFSSNGKYHIGSELKGEERVDIEKPYLSILASSTPDRFYEPISEHFVNDGLFPRWLVFISPEKDKYKEVIYDDGLLDIINQTKYWQIGDLEAPKKTGNLSDYTYKYPTYDVKFPSKPLELEKRFFQSQVIKSDKPFERAFWRRAFQMVQKVCLTLAESNRCTESDIEFASELVKHLTESSIKMCSTNLYDDSSQREYAKWRDKVLTLLPVGKAVSKSFVTKKIWRCKSKLRQDIVSELIDSRIIYIRESDSGETFYTRTQENSEDA